MQEESKYIIYTKSSCPFCVKAQELLKIYDIQYDTISIDSSPLLFEEMKTAWKWKTVPMVFRYTGENPVGTLEFIGGYTDLAKKLDDE